ncbi:MAG: hypothetical protein V1897_06960 [Pseudomonadota bacterium]
MKPYKLREGEKIVTCPECKKPLVVVYIWNEFTRSLSVVPYCDKHGLFEFSK